MRIYKAVGNIIVIICIIVIGAFLVMAVCNVKVVIVASGSMEPTIHTGSICLIDINDEDIAENDIIVFSRGGNDIIHRVVDITDEGYITKGDANSNVDFGVVTADQVQGTFIYTVPYVGYVIDFIGSVSGIICIAVAATLYILIGIMLSSVKRGV